MAAIKAKAFWLVVVLACAAGIFLMGRDDYQLITSHPVFTTGSTVGYQESTIGRGGHWNAVYRFMGDDGQLHDVADKASRPSQSPTLDSQVHLVYPTNHPEQARPVALGMRALGYAILLVFIAIALIALFSRQSEEPVDE
jgi:hypothetical protein